MNNTKDEILKRATELYAKDGYNGVSVHHSARSVKNTLVMLLIL